MSNKKKKVNQGIDPMNNLVMTVSSILAENDFRIRKKKNRELYRSALKETVKKGFIRTHAFVSNWLMDLFELGEISQVTFHEIMEKLPWLWDKTREYFDSLEEIGIVQYSRDSLGRKTCSLVADVKDRARQVENMTCFYKKYEEHTQVSFSDARKEYLNYYEKLNEWLSKNTEIKKIYKIVSQTPSTKIDKFVYDIVEIIGRAKKKELESDLLQFLKQNPLLIYSLERKG